MGNVARSKTTRGEGLVPRFLLRAFSPCLSHPLSPTQPPGGWGQAPALQRSFQPASLIHHGRTPSDARGIVGQPWPDLPANTPRS